MILFIAIVLVLILALLLAYRSWGKLKPGKRIFAILLLAPHLLLILCFAANLSCGTMAVGSVCYNRQFLSAVFAVFILPLPTLVGTAAAFGIFLTAK
jgi:hypothetical protein